MMHKPTTAGRCEIGWIDACGVPTYHDAEPTCYVWTVPHNSTVGGRVIHFEASQRYLCCAEHARQLSEPGMEFWRCEPCTKQS